MMILLKCPFLFLFLLGAESPTPPVMDLKSLLERAEKNALFQRDHNALRRMAAAKLAEVKSLRFLPSFEMKIFGGVVPDASVDLNNAGSSSVRYVNDFNSRDLENDFAIDGLGPFVQMKIEAIQPIYTFGKISNYVEMAEKGKNLAEAERNKKLGELQYLIKRAYYTLQLGNDSKEILKDVESRLNEAAEKVEELLVKNAENVTETDRLKIKVFLADVRNRALDADRATRLSRSALTELANLSGDWELDRKGLAAEKISDLKKEDIISASLRSRPELEQLTDLIEMKGKEIAAHRADMFPTIFVAGEIEYAKAPGRTDVNNPYLFDPFNTFNFGAVLGLKQDLGLYRTLKKVETLEADLDRLKVQRDQLSLKAKLDAERSFEEAFSALASIQVNEEGFRAARSWLTSSGLAFNLGTAETKEILESFAAYFKARVDLMKSLYTLNLALADLSLVTGLEVLDSLKSASLEKR